MLQVVYASAATIGFTQKDLLKLLGLARERNTAAGISGMLLYHNKSFLQVLEGPRQHVDELFTRIQKDPRYKNCLVLLRTEIQKKEFENWSIVRTQRQLATMQGCGAKLTRLLGRAAEYFSCVCKEASYNLSMLE